MTARRQRLTFAAGMLAGIALLPLAFARTPVEGAGARLGLGLRVSAVPAPEVSARRSPFLVARRMTAAAAVRGETVVRNTTGRTVVVRLRASSTTNELDDRLHLRVRIDGLPVYAGPLSGLGAWSERWFQLRRGERRRLQVKARVTGARAGYEGALEDVLLTMRAQVRVRHG